MRSDTNIEALKLLTEQLALTRMLLSTRSPVESKVSIILLDSLADSLMYRRCRDQFEEDTFLAVVKRPKFSPAKRSEVLREFKGKANLLCNIRFITSEDSIVLKIGHSYRNAAYHRDVHNPRVTHEIGSLLFMAVCNLVKSYYKNGVSTGGFEPQPWLAEYGLRTDFINFEGAARTIVEKLSPDVSITLLNARASFQEDLDARLCKIERDIRKLPISCTDAQLDEGLKLAEFEDEHPAEQFSKEVWEMNYKIASGNETAVSPELHVAAESKAKKLRQRTFNKFVPKCSVRLLKQLGNTNSVTRAKTVPSLMSAYHDLDSKFSLFESSVERIASSMDRAIQIERDIRRGK